jgi:hypothetical protein
VTLVEQGVRVAGLAVTTVTSASASAARSSIGLDFDIDVGDTRGGKELLRLCLLL